jgi:hypothetical protein
MGEKKKYNHFWRIKPEKGRNWSSRDYVKYTHTFKELPKPTDAELIETLAKGAIKKGGVGTGVGVGVGTGCKYASLMNLFKKTQHKTRGTRTRTKTRTRTRKTKRRVL